MTVTCNRAPCCAYCEAVTSLVAPAGDLFAFVWWCDDCKIAYDYLTGQVKPETRPHVNLDLYLGRREENGKRQIRRRLEHREH